jgi:hypothetical protein
MTDIAHFGFDNDIEVRQVSGHRGGVAVVPGSSFFNDRKAGRTKVRVCLQQEGRDAFGS